MSEQINDLDKPKRISLSAREKKIRTKLKKALKDSEKSINKEINDIEEEID